MMCFKIYKTFLNTAELHVTGNVQTVLNGYVDNTNLQDDILHQFKYGLGAGSFSDCTCLGEAIVLNQTGYNCYLNPENKIITHKKLSGLKSPFFMGLQLDSHPTHLLEINYEDGISLNDLFEEPTKEFHAYAFVGSFLFKNLACSYLKKAPIFKENINENSDKYWATTEEHPEIYAHLFSVVIRETAKQNFSAETLNKAFYINPLEKNRSSTLSHTHAVLVKNIVNFSELKKDDHFYEKLKTDSDVEIRHVFTQSIVKQGLFALFNLSQ